MVRFIFALSIALIPCGCATDELTGDPQRETPVTQITSGRAGDDKDPELSRDGKHLFYASTSFSGTSDLFLRRIGQNTTVRLTSLPGNERFPKLNPAFPKMLAFCSDSRGTWDIYVMRDYMEAPGRVVPVSEKGTHDIHPSWSPDGRHLVYSSTAEISAGTWVLKILNVETGQVRILEGVDGLLPEWSPRGDRILYQRMKHRDHWFSSIWTLTYKDGTVGNLTAVFSSDDWAAINPSWSPDGSGIVFATVAQSRARSGVLNEADDIWMMKHDGSYPTRLTVSTAADWMPTWSSDGRIYFVSKRSGSNRIWSLKPSLPGGTPPPTLKPGVPIVGGSR